MNREESRARARALVEQMTVEELTTQLLYNSAPIERLGTADVPLPFSPALEFPLIPDEKKIAAKIREMVGAV